MGRRFILSGENMTLSTGSVLAAFRPAAAGAAGSIIEVERVEVTQNTANSGAQTRLSIGSRNSTGTLTVTTATPNPIVLGGPASGIAGGTNPLAAATCGVNSSADTGGTYINEYVVNPNNLGGFSWLAIPEHKLIVVPAVVFAVRFIAAPGTLTGWTCTVWFHEVY
jgi:hypothetical protein